MVPKDVSTCSVVATTTNSSMISLSLILQPEVGFCLVSLESSHQPPEQAILPLRLMIITSVLLEEEIQTQYSMTFTCLTLRSTFGLESTQLDSNQRGAVVIPLLYMIQRYSYLEEGTWTDRFSETFKVWI